MIFLHREGLPHRQHNGANENKLHFLTTHRSKNFENLFKNAEAQTAKV
jgi:hypothetical protein